MDFLSYEKRVVSILIGRQKYGDEYSSISEFKQHSRDAALREEKLAVGWVLWREIEIHQQQQQFLLQHKIITLLKHIASDWRDGYFYHRLVQFWAVVRVQGSHHYLSASHQPFCVPNLKKGLSRYRKACKNHVYKVDMEGEEDDQCLGGVGRAYRNKQPESTPDLRLYSTNEFPLRDEAARSGFGGYMALPLFDLYTNECYGVLELLCRHPIMDQKRIDSSFLTGSRTAGLKSTHISCFTTRHTLDRFEQPGNEIMEILELAIRAVPQLSLAQIWIPCKQCPGSTNLCCMETTSFIFTGDKVVSSNSQDFIFDNNLYYYLRACEFHNLQIDLTCFLRNVSDRNISKYPLAHYAKKARLSHCLAICLQSVNKSNDPVVMIQFFLHLKNREDMCGDSSLHLLLRTIKMKLKSYKFVSIEQFPDELVGQSRQYAIEFEASDMLNVMNSNKESLSELDFTTYLETSCWQRPSSEDSNEGWVFGSPVGEKLIENCVHNNLLMMPSSIKEKIEYVLKKVAVLFRTKYWLIQFWIPKMVENRYCLETLDQPYAIGCLQKGLASYRKECSKHHYFVDGKAKEEELGPPGRVFRNEYPEFTPSLFLYTTKEFCLRNYALHCNLEEYFALPVFAKEEHKCVGVLEFIGFYSYDLYAKDIEGALKVATLSSSYIDLRPRFRTHAPDIPTNIVKALTEVERAFCLIDNIPQLYLAKVWVPYENCATSNDNVRYMELALTTEDMWNYKYANEMHWINYVKPKKGMIGMVLESENKSCFCRNLSEFTIFDQPLAHVYREERFEVCFAICLQSSHTGDLLYVLEFFLNPSLRYLGSFFSYLLEIMKHELKSFKYSCGKQLGEDLVVEVIEFYEGNNLEFSELDQLDGLPFRFKRVQYSQPDHQQGEDESVHCVSNSRQKEQCNTTPNSKRTNRGKRKTVLHLSREDLTPHFGKKQSDAAKELGVGRSTIKRRCRKYGIDRWPNKENHVGNPSLFQRENGQHSQEDMQPSSRSNLRLVETPNRPNVLHKNTETTQHPIVQEEAEKVIIKVKSEEGVIKFELCLKLGLPKLFEEVAMRLKLEMGSFKLKYLDEDDDEVLLTCDADLQYCAKSRKTMGKTYIELLVR